MVVGLASSGISLRFSRWSEQYWERQVWNAASDARFVVVAAELDDVFECLVVGLDV